MGTHFELAVLIHEEHQVYMHITISTLLSIINTMYKLKTALSKCVLGQTAIVAMMPLNSSQKVCYNNQTLHQQKVKLKCFNCN